MEQFSLEKWLEDNSRKVVTRDGREVEIFYSNVNKTLLIGRISDTEIHQYTKDGFQYDTMNQAKNDLFFADKEEELTKFERRFIDLIRFWMSGKTNPEENLIQSRFDAKELLDLARKEILKDLPKWKKAEKDEELDCHVAIRQDGRVVLSDFVQKDEYYITLDVLKKLPKEE